MYRLQISQLIIIVVDADAEEETSVAAVHYPRRIAEFDEVGLVSTVARRYQAVDLWYCVRRLRKAMVGCVMCVCKSPWDRFVAGGEV